MDLALCLKDINAHYGLLRVITAHFSHCLCDYFLLITWFGLIHGANILCAASLIISIFVKLLSAIIMSAPQTSPAVTIAGT